MSFLQSRASTTSTAADRVIRNRLQEEYAKETWYLIGSVIFFFAIVRAGRYFVRSFSTPATQLASSNNATEGQVEAGTTKPNVNAFPVRLWSATATSFRIFFFRFSIQIGPRCLASISELTFICIYMGLMLLWLFVNSRNMWTVMFQDRAAHLASCQLPLIVALAGKNNVISWITGISHEKLNVLHRASARTCLLLAWIHAITRLVSGLSAQFSFQHGWMMAGAVGLGAFTLATILSIRPIRNRFFEFFLITHIIFIIIFLVGALIHAGHNDFGAYVWPALLVWGFDRLVRLGRIVWNNRLSNNESSSSGVTVELLSKDMIRLTLQRQMTWSPGQHAYITVPSIGKLPFESHPFTIASIPEEGKKQQEVVFLIKGCGEFTKRLRDHAVEHPSGGNVNMKAFVDGPYGCPPELKGYSSCILIAGGSGISYTLSLLLDLVRANVRGQKSSVKRIVFVWIIRDAAHLNWISNTLATAMSGAELSIAIEPYIYVTGIRNRSMSELEIGGRGGDLSEVEKSDPTISELTVYESSLNIVRGRPNVQKILEDEIAIATGPISVDVAGPSGLTSTVRKALRTGLATPTSVLKGAQPVTLHVETFGMVTK